MTNEERMAEGQWLAAFGEPTFIAIIRARSTRVKVFTELAMLLKIETMWRRLLGGG